MSDSKKNETDPVKNLRWIDSEPETEDQFVQPDLQRVRKTIPQKMKENPFVPLGLVATVGCLTMGLRSMYQSNSAKQQMFMRGRVLFQGLTIAAMVFGIIQLERRRMAKKNPQKVSSP